MKLETLQIRIRELMSLFVTQVKGATAQGDTFLNLVAETVLVPLLKEVFELPNLKNLNKTYQKNFPGIDLADIPARVSFQITSTATSDKVKETLRLFNQHRLYEQFDRLIIYILTEKQTSYSGSKYDDLIEGKFVFDKDKDIIDFQDILSIVSGFDIERAERVLKVLESYIGSSGPKIRSEIPMPPPIEGQEAVFLNLLSISFPENLYIAEMTIDREETIRESWHRPVKLNWDSTSRDVARAALEQKGFSFAVDWIVHENKIITFHDLTQSDLALREIIDVGSIESLPTASFYKIDENYDRVFKDLLRRCVQQLLYHRNIHWQYEERLFIFMRNSEDEDIRSEVWYGKSFPSRVVYEAKRNPKDPEKISKHIHFGFETNFKQFDGKWYVAITPEWFVSYDGYIKSYYGADFIKYKKKMETNQHVNTHVRFVAHFLKNHHAGLFDSQDHKIYPFLSFGDFVHFNNSPKVKVRKPSVLKPKRKQSKASSKEQNIPTLKQEKLL